MACNLVDSTEACHLNSTSRSVLRSGDDHSKFTGDSSLNCLEQKRESQVQYCNQKMLLKDELS